jgi:hypothetical protein
MSRLKSIFGKARVSIRSLRKQGQEKKKKLEEDVEEQDGEIGVYYDHQDFAEGSEMEEVVERHQFRDDEIVECGQEDVSEGLDDGQALYMPVVATTSSFSLQSIVAKETSFLERGWNGFHCSLRGGGISPGISATILRNTVRYLIRIALSSFLIEECPNIIERTTITHFLQNVVNNESWHDAVSLAAENYPWSPATHYTHLLHFRISLKFYRFIFMPMKHNKARRKHLLAVETFVELVSDLMRGVKKAISKEKRNKDMSLQKKVFDGKYPAGGMKELRDAAAKEGTRMLLLFSEPTNKKVLVTERLYGDFMQTFFSVLYTFAPQGRPGGIQELTMKDLIDIYAKCFATVTKFKTARYLRYQAVIFTDLSQQLLRIYIAHLRPVVQPRNQVTHRDDPLFLDWNGRKLVTIHWLLKAFFNRTIPGGGLHITSNTLRKIMETEADSRGDITEEDRKKLSSMVGHGRATAKTYYIYDDAGLAADVVSAMKAYGTAADDPVLRQIAAAPVAVYAQDVWGINHPDLPSAKRARWTDDEKSYLQNVVDDISAAESGESPSANIMALALKTIKSDPATRSIFHSRHIRDSGRLRSGLRTQEKKM